MKNDLKFLSVLCVAFLSVLSCKKNHYNPNDPVYVTPPLNKLFADLRSIPQELSVTAGRDTMVFGSKGTMLHFYANSFRYANGATITSGIIKLKLVEMYKPGDMIRNRATTMAGANLLRSGGQISVDATLNGEKVNTNKYGVGFIQPTTPTLAQPMALFYGNTNNRDSVVSWEVADTGKQRWNLAWPADSVKRMPIAVRYGQPWVGYVFDSASTLNYTNCDQFYDSDSPRVSVSVVLPDNSFLPSNTQVYLILPDINCAMSTVEPMLGGAGFDAATKTIKLLSETQTNIIPAGMKYILVVVAIKNGQYYYFQQPGTIPHNGLKTPATMTPESKESVLSKLAAF